MKIYRELLGFGQAVETESISFTRFSLDDHDNTTFTYLLSLIHCIHLPQYEWKIYWVLQRNCLFFVFFLTCNQDYFKLILAYLCLVIVMFSGKCARCSTSTLNEILISSRLSVLQYILPERMNYITVPKNQMECLELTDPHCLQQDEISEKYFFWAGVIRKPNYTFFQEHFLQGCLFSTGSCM